MPLDQGSPIFRLVAGGDYADVVARFVDAHEAEVDASDVPWIIGALTFVGRTYEAEGYFASREKQLTTEAQVAGRFFLAVAACREGKTAIGRQLLTRNMVVAKRDGTSVTRYFAAQGFAFMRYTSGRLPVAELWAKTALKAAAGASFHYGSVLTLELLGHIQLSAGQVRAGFRSLEMARAKANGLGQGALLQAMKISEVLYRSTFGIAGSAAAVSDELQSALASCHYEDSYTRASLTLELARVRILQGKLAESKTLIHAASELVYRIDNPDLEIDHNPCLASLLQRQGDAHQALCLIRGARHRAATRQDLRPLLRVLGLEAQLLRELGRDAEHAALLPEVERLTRRTGSWIGRRMLARQAGSEAPGIRPGEDLLGDLTDDAWRQAPTAVAEILASGWHGLLSRAIDLRGDAQVLKFDLEPGSLTIFDRGEVLHLADGCSDFMRKLIVALSEGEASKETLAMQLWGRSYNPLRHDGLIYGLVGKTRRLLGAQGAWLEACEMGYRLRAGVRVMTRRLRTTGPQEATRAELPAVETRTMTTRLEPRLVAALNIRQMSLLGWLREGETVDTRIAIDRLGVSDATASRDLAALVDLGLAQRIGRGRATKYSLAVTTSGQPPSERQVQ